jgi:hypothetical protein
VLIAAALVVGAALFVLACSQAYVYGQRNEARREARRLRE